MTPNPRTRVRGRCLRGRLRVGVRGFAGGLVAAGGVEVQFAEQFAGGGVDDADVQVLDEQQDVGPGVGAADADVVEPAGVAQGDGAVGVDAVGADPVVGVALRLPGVALGRAA